VFEPFVFAKVIATSDKWPLFLDLRAQEDVEPNMGYLATETLEKWLYSVPQPLRAGEWHLPFIKEEDKLLSFEYQVRRSVARCARVSYMNFEGTNDLEKDMDLYDKLLESGHMSPFEHQVKMTPGNKLVAYSVPFTAYRHTLDLKKNC
jgi:thymidylate synthase ThyX